MINIQLYSLITFVYLLCTVLYLVHLLFKLPKVGQAATVVAFFTFLVHLVAFIVRWIESYQLGIGHLPIRGPYECLTFAAGAIVLFYLIIEHMIKTRAFGAFIFPLVFLFMVFATLSAQIDKQIVPLPEVLQGDYMSYHLASCFIGYAAFSVSFVSSILFLVNRRGQGGKTEGFKGSIPAPEVLDTISYRMIAIGFVMFTILIVTGMFRSSLIWGSYWEWDPVQTWSLIAWLVYAVILHGRFIWRLSATMTALLSLIGFALSIISFLAGAGFIFSSGHFPITG